MAKCDHPGWLELRQGDAGPLLSHGWRLPHILKDFPNPSEQCPQITLMLGRQLKDKALKRLCESNYRGQRRKNAINLRADNRSLRTMEPRLFADCDPTSKVLEKEHITPQTCHQEHTLTVRSLPYDIHDLILARLIFMFVDVICIFADDVGGLDVVAHMLLRWAEIGSGSSLSYVIRPRVIIVVNKQSKSITHDVLDEKDFLFDLYMRDSSLNDTFKAIGFSHLPSDELLSGRFLSLGASITRQLHDARFIRNQKRVLFSATHLNELFGLGIVNLCQSPLNKFDFIANTRNQNPLDGAFNSHLKEFLSLAGKSKLPYEGISSHIASAILLDAYPPGMHLFCPKEVFHSLYYDICYTAHREIFSTDELSKLQCDRIEDRLYALFEYMRLAPSLSSEVHSENLKGQGKYWGWLKSNRTCLVCLRRSPEHTMSCGHSICDICTQIFGEQSLNREAEYHIHQCLICGDSQTLTIQLKPCTSASRIVSIDGGGPRGIIPLENLEILQEQLGPDIQLSDMIDFAIGCSSGGLIALSKFMMRMDVQSCKALFQDLAKKVLAPTRRRKLLRSLLSDGLYDVEALEEALQDHYGPTRRLFDTPPANLSSNKVAVIASEIQDGAPFIFANYNGAAPHRAEPAYERLRPDSEAEPYVWQVARATSAAPSLFPTVNIPGIGTFQDGGMRRHNNPVNLALSEAKHLWPNSPGPDVLISLGTGSGPKENPCKSVSNFRNVLVDGWMPRIYRSFSSSFEGSCTWREFLDSINERHRDDYFRFDIIVSGGLPRMDNVDCMDKLSKLVRSDPAGVQKHREAIASLLASSFYFQLDAKPEYYSGFLQCIGSVRCRAPAHYVLNWINRFDSSQKDFYKDSINLGIHLSSDDICDHCQRYSRRLRFMVRDLKQTIGLSIQFGGRSHSLSALPNSIQWFIEQQGLDGTFGTPTHKQTSPEFGCPICDVPRAKGQWHGKKRKFVDI